MNFNKAVGMEMSNCIYCFFYTSEEYREVSLTLEESLRKYNLDFYSQEYQSRGSWRMNTAIKPQFILDVMQKYPGRPIVYLDADCEVCSYPNFFDEVSGDIAVYFAPVGKGYSHKVLTGTMYFKSNERVRCFVESWKDLSFERMDYNDQDSFEEIYDSFMIKGCSEDIKFSHLPSSYIKIFDDELNDSIGVIQHYQASRRFNEQRINKRSIFNRIRRSIYKRIGLPWKHL